MAKILKQEAEAFSLKRKREWLGDEYGVYSPRNQRDRNKVDVKPFNRDIDILLKILSVATCRSHSISTRKDHLPPTYLQKKRSRTHATSAAVERAKWESQVRLFLLFKSHGVVGKSFAILYVCDGCGFRVMPNVTLRHVAESACILSISHPSGYLPSAAAVLYQPDSCELPLLPDTCSILFWIYSQPKEIASSRLTSFPAISRGVSQG